MSIVGYTEKPAFVRACGPWDGTDESLGEIQSFVGAELNKIPGFIRLIGTAQGEGAARVWDAPNATWATVRIGEYVIERPGGGYRPIGPEELREKFDPIGDGSMR